MLYQQRLLLQKAIMKYVILALKTQELKHQWSFVLYVCLLVDIVISIYVLFLYKHICPGLCTEDPWGQYTVREDILPLC